MIQQCTNPQSRFQSLNNSPVLPLDTIVIKTDRLMLKPVSDKYVEAIFAEFTPEITRYMAPRPAEKIEESKEFVTRSVIKMTSGTDLVMAILDATSEQFLGCVGLHGRESNMKTAELGVWLKKNAHGFGYGKEAVTAVYNWAITNIVLDYFIYPVDRANTPSCKIPESLGGKVVEENIAETMREGETLDELVYHIPGNSEY